MTESNHNVSEVSTLDELQPPGRQQNGHLMNKDSESNSSDTSDNFMNLEDKVSNSSNQLQTSNGEVSANSIPEQIRNSNFEKNVMNNNYRDISNLEKETMENIVLSDEKLSVKEKILSEASSKRVSVDACQICQLKSRDEINPSNYRCPACNIIYCSLSCSKMHKQYFNCSGERDPTKFVPLSSYDDSILNSDFRFLEESRNKQSHLQMLKSRKRMREPDEYRIGKKELFFISRAKDRHCFLKILSEGMKRRKENRTQYINGQECFVWHTRFFFEKDLSTFGEASQEPLIIKSQVNENTIISDAYEKVISLLNPTQRQILQNYISREDGTPTKFEELMFLLRAESVKRPGRWFTQLNAFDPLRVCLEKRIIVENPDIYVVPQKYLTQYNLLSLEEAGDLYNIEVEDFQERKRRRIEYRERIERFDHKTGDGSNLLNWDNFIKQPSVENETNKTNDDSIIEPV